MRVFWDTEDNSPDLAKEGRSGFEKQCTQIAAIREDGKRFHDRPKVLKSKKENGITRYTWNVEPFLNFLSDCGPGCEAWAWNTQYDLGNIFPDNLDEFRANLVGSRLVNAKWDNVIFKDGANIWPMALKKVGDAIGLKKLETDVHSQEYVFRDCEIVQGAINHASDFCDEFGVDLSSTLGGLCIKIWQSMGGANWQCALEPARQAYFGGRVDLFKTEACVTRSNARILYVDVNSLYPSVMLNHFPTSTDLHFGLNTLADAERLLRSDAPCWGIAKVVLDIPPMFLAPVPVRVDEEHQPDIEGKIILYPTGTVQGWYTVHEIREACRMGSKLLKVEECYGSRTAERYYADYVLHMYKRRKEATDDATKLFLKLLMNNLYGQLGMSGIVTQSLTLADNLIFAEGRWHLTREGIPYGKRLLADVQMPLPEHANWLHAAYVTSYARLTLLKYLRMIPAEQLIYCDTDSIIFEWGKGPLPFPLSMELGEMKLEKELQAVMCVAPKMYRTKALDGKIETKAKGVPRREGLQEKFFDTGQASFQQPWKLRESIAYVTKNQLNGIQPESRVLSVWHDITKHHSKTFDKKVLQGKRWLPKSLSVAGQTSGEG